MVDGPSLCQQCQVKAQAVALQSDMVEIDPSREDHPQAPPRQGLRHALTGFVT